MATTYLSHINTTPTSAYKYTWSGWLKRSEPATRGQFFRVINPADTGAYTFIEFGSNDKLGVADTDGVNFIYRESNAVFRDFSAWYHIVVKIDTTQATASNRITVWVNGETISWGTTTDGIQNQVVSSTASGKTKYVGGDGSAAGNTRKFGGLMAHVHFCDGYTYDASAFGETDATTGIWKPKTAPSVTYGTNGFFLKFENSGSLGTDSSGNANNFTVNGTPTQTVDTPSNVFATLNPLYLQNDSLVFSNGNLTASKPSGVGTGSYFGTLGVSKGKWYWEMKASNLGGSSGWVGVGQMTTLQSSNYPGNDPYCIAAASNEATLRYNGSNVSSGTYSISSWTANDIVQIALDMDNSRVYWGINNTWQNSGNPSSGTGGYTNATIFNGDYLLPLASLYQSGGVYHYNFGNGYFGTTAVASGNADGNGLGIFEYAPPTGYLALCTKNINSQEYS